MKQKEIIIFCKQLAQIAEDDVGFKQGIKLTIGENKMNYIGKERIVKKLEEGESLVRALADEHIFSDEMLEMIQIGMQTGNLKEVFNRLAYHYEYELVIKKYLRAAFYYPLLLGSMVLVILGLLVTRIIPVFKEVFEETDVVAGGMVKGLFEVGNVVGVLIMIIIAISWFIVFAGNFTKYFKQIKQLWSNLIMREDLIEQVEIIHLVTILSILIRDGRDLEKALIQSMDVVSRPRLQRKLKKCLEEWQSTQDLMKALNQSHLFHPFIREKLVLSLRTQTLDQGLLEAATYYETHLEEMIEIKLSRIEPISIIVISILLMAILVAVIIPLLNLISTLS